MTDFVSEAESLMRVTATTGSSKKPRPDRENAGFGEVFYRRSSANPQHTTYFLRLKATPRDTEERTAS